MVTDLRRSFFLAGAWILMIFAVISQVHAAPKFPGAIFTTNDTGTAVNWNLYPLSTDVYLNGGPQNTKASGLPDGNYYFQVTDPSGKTLLSTDNAVCRQLLVAGGRVVAPTGPCPHAAGTLNPANGGTPVQLAPFSPTPNLGGVYKAWLIPTGQATIGTDPKVLSFSNANAKTDNFKVAESTPPPPVGSCQPSSSLSVMANGPNVVAYVPKGNWSVTPVTGIAVVDVEGSSTLPTTNPIPTTNVVNSCASNSVTGQTVCTANTSAVYVIAGLSATPTVTTLASAGIGTVGFSGGLCTNCGVAMDAVNNKAVVGLSLAGVGGFQFLNLGTNTFEPAFPSLSPSFGPANISEDPLIDPIRNLLLNATENNQYELIDVATSTSPAFYENAISVPGKELDSSGEDCETGIILAPAEFSGPSQVYIANLSSTSAAFTTGAPGSWSAPSQVQSLSESSLAAGASGIAVAQGTHLGVVSGEFGGDQVTAIALPTAIDTSATTPAISDWVSCNIGGGFSNGFDPHTVTAYQSPTSGHAIAVLANGGATSLAVVDLTNMLDTTIVPRTVGGHACAAGPLPATVVSFKAVP